MSQKAARSGGEARGVCSLGAPLPQWVLAGVLYRHGPRSRYGSNCRFRSRRNMKNASREPVVGVCPKLCT